jgi:phytoene dehydrogenase-like protein
MIRIIPPTRREALSKAITTAIQDDGAEIFNDATVTHVQHDDRIILKLDDGSLWTLSVDCDQPGETRRIEYE